MPRGDVRLCGVFYVRAPEYVSISRRRLVCLRSVGRVVRARDTAGVSDLFSFFSFFLVPTEHTREPGDARQRKPFGCLDVFRLVAAQPRVSSFGAVYFRTVLRHI